MPSDVFITVYTIIIMGTGTWGLFIKPNLKKLSVFVLLTLIYIYEIRSTMFSFLDLPFVIALLPVLFVSHFILKLKIIGNMLMTGLVASLYLYLFSCLIVLTFEHFHNAQKKKDMLKALLAVVVLLLIIVFLWQLGII